MKCRARFLLGLLATPIFAAGAEAAQVYIPQGSADEVLILDAETNAVTGRIPGLADVHGLGGVPSGRYLVAGSYSETAAEKMPAVDKPGEVSQDEHEAHHNPAIRPASGSVSILTIIAAADGSVVRRLEVPGAVHHVAVSPDGRYAVATHPNADGVSIVDLETLTVRDLVRTGPSPGYAVFSADGTKVYVSNAGNGTVSEIDIERSFVERNMLAGEVPEHLVLSLDGTTLYVANVEAGMISALALAQGKVVRSFAIGGELHGLDISEDGRTLFVSGKGEDKLVAVDLESGTMRSAPLGPAPYHLTVIRGTGKVYVSSRDEPVVWVVDQTSLEVRGTIAISGEGHQMVVLP